MSLIVVDRKNDNVVGEISSEDGLISAVYRRKRENDEMTLDVELSYKDSHIIKQGYSLVIQDEEGILREFEIDDYEEVDGDTVLVNCAPTYLSDLGLSRPISQTIDLNNKTTEELLNILLDETIWETGEVDSAGAVPMDREKDEYPLNLIGELKSARGLISDYYVEINLGRIVSRKVDLRFPREINNGKEIERGKDLISLKRRESIVDTITALRVVGSRTETVQDSEGNEVEEEIILTVDVVNDEIQNKIGRPGNYRYGLLESQSDNEEDLREEGIKKLRELSKIYEGFEVDVEDLSMLYPHESVRFGDTVHIKDYNYDPVLITKGEIVEVEYDVSDESTKKYLVGDSVRLKDVIDSLRENFDSVNMKILGLEDRYKRVSQKLVEISEPEEEPEGPNINDLVHYNLLKRGSLREGGSTQSNFEYYDANLEVDFTTGSNGVGMEVHNFQHEKGTVYTLSMEVEVGQDVGMTIGADLPSGNVLNYYRYMIDEEGREGSTRIYSNRVDFILDSNEGKKQKIDITFSSSNDGISGRMFRFNTDVGDVEVKVSNLIVYKGTPKYGDTNLLDGDSILPVFQGDFKDTYSDNRGYSYKIPEGTELPAGREFDAVKIGLPGVEDNGRFKRLRFSMKVTGNEDSKGEKYRVSIELPYGAGYRLNGNVLLYSEVIPYYILRDSEGDVIGEGPSDRNGDGIVVVGLGEDVGEGKYFEVDMAVSLYQGDGSAVMVRLDSETYRGRGVQSNNIGFEMSNIRMYDGIAPEGVVLDDKDFEGDLIELRTTIEKLKGMIEAKADKDHDHSTYDITDFSERVSSEITSNGVVKREEFDSKTWEIDSIEGLRGELNDRPTLGSSVTISQVVGLEDIIAGLIQEIEDLKGN